MSEIASATVLKPLTGHHDQASEQKKNICAFQMPLHYPRFQQHDYEKMSEWKLDCLLKEYGLPLNIGDLNQKRKFAMGAFLWT
ncbi:uncharacterized protein LOC112499643 [Cynara cardunculus var. scolymus]|uniref:DUF7722 domain-containing protein n=1 Tax=Cynara cardunculus var. scolymus TaxID=59895 RepID=A0A103XJE2_CYNCS|nr:uncharacterized protein LOC112499643 [Cynara cardunculus var. scolymus]KVH91836.1 hypothetical protein Ccrd_006149 [Cynara cardunculus var. scolymus]